MAGRGGRRSTTWGPGQGGRKAPPIEKQARKELAELARDYTEEALERLAFWMRSDHSSASPTCAAILLERGHGKPTQRVEATGANGGPMQFENVADDRPPLSDMLIAAREALADKGETRH